MVVGSLDIATIVIDIVLAPGEGVGACCSCARTKLGWDWSVGGFRREPAGDLLVARHGLFH